MIPALIKCQPTATQKVFFVETLMFIPKDMKNLHLRLAETLNKKSVNEQLVTEKQMTAFETMVAAGDFIEVKFVQLELEFLNFLGEKIGFRKIDFRRVERVKNSMWILDMVKKNEHSSCNNNSLNEGKPGNKGNIQ